MIRRGAAEVSKRVDGEFQLILPAWLAVLVRGADRNGGGEKSLGKHRGDVEAILEQHLADPRLIERLGGPQQRTPGSDPLLPTQARTVFRESSREDAQRPKRRQKGEWICAVQ